jgi:prepilin-type N-terminal cleavage/methylation domain-containing protein
MSRRRGFTLLELMTVIVVIGILAVMLVGATEKVRSRIEKFRCSGNLRTLHVAVNAYVQQNGQWPQINTALAKNQSFAYADAWIKALEPFGAARGAWLCPTLRRTWGEPDFKTPETSRTDYMPTPFDSKQFTPFKWSRQPWFIEKGDLHGNGNLMIFPDGHIAELNEMVKVKK